MKATETVNRLESTVANGPKTEAKAAPEKVVYGEFGKGRYSGLAKEAYGDGIRLIGLTEKEADKFARTLAADWGRAQFEVTAKYGRKADKDGMITLREASKAKVRETRAITLARALVALQDAKVLIGEVESNFKGFVLSKEMSEWLNS